MITRRGFLRFFGGSVLAAMSFSAYAVGIEPMLLTHVKRYSLTPPGWPDGLKLRVVALADIHACRPWMTPERIGSIVEQANASQPDLIVLLGDYVAGMRLVTDWVDAAEWAPALSGLEGAARRAGRSSATTTGGKIGRRKEPAAGRRSPARRWRLSASA